MTFLQILFYAVSAVAIFSGLMVVTLRNSVHSALFLVLTFFCMAVSWMLLHAEFLALVLVVVYVGAVMTLFLFVVMMLNLDREPRKEGFVRYLPLSILIMLMITGISVVVLGPKYFGLAQMPMPAPTAADYSNTTALGDVLYSVYAYPFEIAAVLLLTAIVAAISLTHRLKRHTKRQSIPQQIDVNPKDRVRLVDIPSSPRVQPNKPEA